MWIKDVDGDFVNIETGSVIKNTYAIVFVPNPDESEKSNILFDDTVEKRQKYMAELEKELAAFGKLVKVKVE